MANWPADDLSTSYLDNPATDRPDQARVQILAAIQKLQTVLAAAGTDANQVLKLDVNGAVRGVLIRNGGASASTTSIAIGSGVMNSTSGDYNLGIGAGTLQNATTCTSVIAVGPGAGTTVTTGSNLLILGQSAEPSSGVVANEITLGNSSIATLRCQVTSITALSDARDKKDITDIPIGLNFINTLRPVKFTWSRRDGTKEGIQEVGFIAQELDGAQQAFSAEEYLDLVMKSNPDKLEAAPGKLLPVLVKAIQELSTKNAELEKRLSEMENRQ